MLCIVWLIYGGKFLMKFCKIEHVKNDQIMIIQNEMTDIYQVIVECETNYSFSPDYVSKGFKSYSGALNHFNKLLFKYQNKVIN